MILRVVYQEYRHNTRQQQTLSSHRNIAARYLCEIEAAAQLNLPLSSPKHFSLFYYMYVCGYNTVTTLSHKSKNTQVYLFAGNFSALFSQHFDISTFVKQCAL